jgi:hypothetical protein
MSLAAIRLAMMERFDEIPDAVVPQDPLPHQLQDKSILMFPRVGSSELLSPGKGPKVAVRLDGTMQVEYHRRIPYEHIGSSIPDITEMVDTIVEVVWSEMAGGKFGGTILSILGVSLNHLGALGWNEWTFGARMDVQFRYLEQYPS